MKFFFYMLDNYMAIYENKGNTKRVSKKIKKLQFKNFNFLQVVIGNFVGRIFILFYFIFFFLNICKYLLN